MATVDVAVENEENDYSKDGLDLVNTDPMLEQHKGHLQYRWEKFREVKKAIEMVDLQDVAHVDVGRLSGGQKQRAVIARALASEAEFILLDEPLVGIDSNTRNSLLKLLDKLCNEQEKTILMVSHDLTEIRQTAH